MLAVVEATQALSTLTIQFFFRIVDLSTRLKACSTALIEKVRFPVCDEGPKGYNFQMRPV